MHEKVIRSLHQAVQGSQWLTSFVNQSHLDSALGSRGRQSRIGQGRRSFELKRLLSNLHRLRELRIGIDDGAVHVAGQRRQGP